MNQQPRRHPLAGVSRSQIVTLIAITIGLAWVAIMLLTPASSPEVADPRDVGPYGAFESNDASTADARPTSARSIDLAADSDPVLLRSEALSAPTSERDTFVPALVQAADTRGSEVAEQAKSAGVDKDAHAGPEADDEILSHRHDAAALLDVTLDADTDVDTEIHPGAEVDDEILSHRHDAAALLDDDAELDANADTDADADVDIDIDTGVDVDVEVEVVTVHGHGNHHGTTHGGAWVARSDTTVVDDLPSQATCISRLLRSDQSRPVGTSETPTQIRLTTMVEIDFDTDVTTATEVDVHDPIAGRWHLTDGALIQSNAEGYDLITNLLVRPPTDYSIGVDVAGADGHLGGGIVLGQLETTARMGALIVDFADGGDFVRWGCYDDRSGVYRYLGGAGLGPTFEPSEPHHLRVTVIDDIATVSVDERAVGRVRIVTNGSLGFVTSLSQGRFDNLDISGVRIDAQ
ncbi:MAG: hypothetical protein AAF567_24950 [Actinomycetota bacterium]